eukprot:TRINITY_DN6570_c0_g1_i3.p1 TRINITY_DN6570_c0_g1~~TRINITY_DN6570_c0_g1_i3.p1  ORF type:complete len:791 (+),score=97.78 TRINITY_DN6570_c0_g1_i3:101-2473(+)
MPLLLRAQCCLWLCCWSCCHCPAAAFDYTWPPPMRIEPQAFWRDFVDNDVLSGSFVQYVNCDVKPWDQFREAFQAHFYSGEWKEDGETWFGKATASNLLSMAEAIVQRWQDQDLQPSSAAGSSGGSATSVLSIMQKVYEFLVRISHPPGEISVQSFTGACLPGILAAVCVYARMLEAMSKSHLNRQHLAASSPSNYSALQPQRSVPEDIFKHYQSDLHHLISSIVLNEGLLLPDLFSVPGWPGIDTRLLEEILHRPRRDEHTLNTERSIPSRMPTPQRYYSATDPQGVSSWGRQAVNIMAARADMLHGAWVEHGPRQELPWHVLGPPHMPSDSAKLESEFCPGLSHKVRMLSMISGHGALDLEIPELLLQLFPRWFEPRFLMVTGEATLICARTEGSTVLDKLCPDWLESRRLLRASRGERRSLRHRRRRRHRRFRYPWYGRTWLQRKKELGTKHKLQLFEGVSYLHPRDPRVFFETGHGDTVIPDLITTANFLEAMYMHWRFPSVPLILFFGAPVLFQAAEDVASGNLNILNKYWNGVRDLMLRASDGKVLIAAESLFRSEQFFWQTGVEVPFLRPMSVWINASYAPRSPKHHGGAVLLHSRGRLKHEHEFFHFTKLMAGSNFPYDLVPQRGMVPFKTIAGFHAVVIVPWSPELCMLRNLFRMRMPLLVPDRSLLRNLVHVANMRIMPFPYFGQHPQLDKRIVNAVHPYDPFQDTIRSAGDERGMRARAYWAEYSEYLLLPEQLLISQKAFLFPELFPDVPPGLPPGCFRIFALLAASHLGFLGGPGTS